MRTAVGTLSLLLATGAITAPVAGEADSGATRKPYELPVLDFSTDDEGYFVPASDEAYARYLWESFIALNWPAGKVAGEPDPSATVPASRSPVVWETYAYPGQVFLPSDRWADYPRWPLARPDLPAACKSLPLPPGETPIVLEAVNQPSAWVQSPMGPLIDQNGRYVRYQVGMNRRYFEYLRETEYYNAGQQRLDIYAQREDPTREHFRPLPIDEGSTPGMIEYKSAWKVLGEPDDPERFYTRWAYLVPSVNSACEIARVGLVALHIHRLTLLSHVATTFEQVDNVRSADLSPSFNPGGVADYGNRGFQGEMPPPVPAATSPLPAHPPVNVSRATPLLPAIEELNAEYQERVGDSPLRYYMMIGAQHVAGFCRARPKPGGTLEWKPAREKTLVTAGVVFDPGCPVPNVDSLINAALESYTQRVDPRTRQSQVFSCQSCHSHARPCCVQYEDSIGSPRFQVMSYFMSKAMFPGQPAPPPGGYTCSEPPPDAPWNLCSEAGPGQVAASGSDRPSAGAAASRP